MSKHEHKDRRSHEGIERDSWDMLVNGALNSKEPFHFPVLGTQGAGEPELRIVVLREAIQTQKQLIIHTDIRSPKISQLKHNSRVGFLFYDPQRLIQLRIKARATIYHQDDLAAKQWQSCQISSRRAYLGKSPGNLSSVVTHGLPDHLQGTLPSPEESEAGFVNFAAIVCQVTSMDWLWLYGEGHQRAQFTYDKAGKWLADWVTP